MATATKAPSQVSPTAYRNRIRAEKGNGKALNRQVYLILFNAGQNIDQAATEIGELFGIEDEAKAREMVYSARTHHNSKWNAEVKAATEKNDEARLADLESKRLAQLPRGKKGGTSDCFDDCF